MLFNNPWGFLGPADPPYVLEIDREQVDRHNRLARSETRIITDSFPQPYIGNPKTARVVLLALNPGHSIYDEEDHSTNRDFKRDTLLNLRHELVEHPFYPLNPKFHHTGAGRWWMSRTKAIQERVDLDILSERLMVIEWFPYHSERFEKLSGLLPSQKYSFELAKELMGQTLMIRMRSRREWTEVHPEFAMVPALRNPRCGHVSERNTDEGLFEKIIAALGDE